MIRRRDGSFEYLNETANFELSGNHLQTSLSNLVLFTALDIRSTYFSRGRVCVLDTRNDNKEIENDKFLDLIANPSFSQSQQDYLYSSQWKKCLGTGVTRVITRSERSDPNNIDNISSLRNLVQSNINYGEVNKVKKMKFAKSDIRKIKEQEIEYSLSGKKFKIPLKELLFFYDVTNGLVPDSEFISPSRIEALKPSLCNIDEAQRSKNINLRVSAKHLISNDATMQGTSMQLQPKEREEIEGRFFDKDIMATNTKASHQSLANNFRQLLYDDNIAADATKVFTAYGINRDVISYWSQGQTTYDNKSTGLLDFIQNTLEFEGSDWGNTWTNFLGYKEQGKKIVMKFDHLPIYQEAEKQKMQILTQKVDIFKTLIDAGADFKTASMLVNLNDLKQGTQTNGTE